MAPSDAIAIVFGLIAAVCAGGWIIARQRLTSRIEELALVKGELKAAAKEAGEAGAGVELAAKALAATRKDKEALERTARVLGEERQVLELVAHGASLPEIFTTLTEAVERVAPGCMCSILLVDPATGHLTQGAAPNLPAAYWAVCRDIPIMPDLGCCSSAAFRNQMTIAEDISTDPRWAPIREMALGFGLRACWSAPIRDSSKNTVLGTFAMYHSKPATPDELELKMVEAGAQLAGRAIERVRAHQDLIEQVSAKERALAELAGAQERLIALSRQAGMAEVAIGVLHNVGNALNSVNVSASLIGEKIRESRIDNLASLVKMLEENTGRLDDYLANDARGSRVLPYLSRLSAHFSEERRNLLGELDSLTGNIGHIREIVATQQRHATVVGLLEEVSLETLIDDAFRMIHPGFERHEIEVRREYAGLPPIMADKHRILQILLNLLNNAKRAIKETSGAERVLTIRTRTTPEGMAVAEVHDTGVGIAPEHLTKIFAQGFTTRRDGHGFGLHSAVMAAQQMGGTLRVESDGPGLGAKFVLELPLAPAAATSDSRAVPERKAA